MGSPERRQREREEMRSLICRAAMKIFLEEGFEKASIRRIAEEIEYTPGAIYSYFEDKDAILFALHTEGFARLRQELLRVNGQRPAFARLEALGRTYLRFALDNPEYYDLMFIMSSTIARAQQDAPDDARWTAGQDTYELLRQAVRDCQEEGSLPEHPVEGATLALWSLVHGIGSLAVKQRLAMIPEAQRKAAIDSAFEFGLKGLRLSRA